MHFANLRTRIARRGFPVQLGFIADYLPPEIPAERERTLWASVTFVVECWVVFSRLSNEYIFKPLNARKKWRKK